MNQPRFRAATSADSDAVVSLMRAYYFEDGYPFYETRARAALTRLVADPTLGRVFVFENENEIVGYVALTFGFSLEYLGRDAFVDELYVVPDWRGRGLGRRALARVEAACRGLGVVALHLEVERDKAAAKRLYQRSGFEAHERSLMTKWLEPPSSDR